MASGNGPWGGGGNRGGSGGGDEEPKRGGGRGGDGGQMPPEIDELVRKGQEQLRVLMGGKGGGKSGGPGGSSGGGLPNIGRVGFIIGGLVAAALYALGSSYTVAPNERGVELFLGKPYRVTDDGLHFAWWPFVTLEVLPALDNKTVEIGINSSTEGVMLTTDANVVDIDFQVVWVISDPQAFYFNLAGQGIEGGRETVAAVAESAMREVVAQFEFAPIINRERATIAAQAQNLVQSTLDDYNSGIRVVRLNLQTVQSPSERVTIEQEDGNVITTSPLDAFRDVQAAEQERDRFQRQADAYSNRVLAQARGEAARLRENAEGYRARVINEAVGEASRFLAVLGEYEQAPEVTRQRLYLETMERVLGQSDKVILDQSNSGAIPYLPLNEFRRSGGGNN